MLRDLDGKPVKAKAGVDPAEQRAYYHTVMALKGRKAEIPSRGGSYTGGAMIITKERYSIPAKQWNTDWGKGCVRVTASDPRLHPPALARLEEAVRQFIADGYAVTVTSANRTYAQQKYLFEEFKAGRGPKAADPDGNPPHLTGGAIDIRISKDGVSSTPGNKTAYEMWKQGKRPAAELALNKHLQKVLSEAGWSRWKGEPWHFEYGTTGWKRANGAPSFGRTPGKAPDY